MSLKAFHLVFITAACLLAVFVGATVQATIGMGTGMVAAPILAFADPDFIPAAILISILPLTFAVAWGDRAHIDRRGVGVALIGRVPGLIVGAYVAASLSDDEGRTWKWTRHFEHQPEGSYHYPAVTQGADGTIHAVYSYFVTGGKSMKHVACNEAWIEAGDGAK